MNSKVLFNIPNTIGYIRIILLYSSIFNSSIVFIMLYSSSMLLDALDGYMARKFNQSTFLGACLDMFTDRVSTVVIFMKIISHDPNYLEMLLFLILTDLLPHLLYFSNAISTARHHKNVNNFFLRLYYKRKILFFLCIMTDIYFLSLYASIFMPIIKNLLYYLRFFAFIKAFFHFVHFWVALTELSLYENIDISKTE